MVQAETQKFGYLRQSNVGSYKVNYKANQTVVRSRQTPAAAVPVERASVGLLPDAE